jgi:hypothetical protein
MKNAKKWIKIAGNLLMVAALVFLVKKFIAMDVNWSQLGSPSVIAALVLGFAVQTLIFVMGTYPWLMFTQALSGTKIPFSRAMPVFTRSNLYKYVPGNVFQYIGRNQLAADMSISHADVACATVLDILFCLPPAAIISAILLGSTISELLVQYGQRLLILGCIGLLAAVVLAAVLYHFRHKLREKLSHYARAFRKENLPGLLKGVLYYFLQYIVSSLTYFVALSLIFGGKATTAQLLTMTGAFLFAWIIGYITPGAPGGIGIRETVMTMVCGAAFEQDVLLFVLVMRIASILADLSAFAIGTVYMGYTKHHAKSKA